MKKSILKTTIIGSIATLAFTLPMIFVTTSCSKTLNPNYIWITSQKGAWLNFGTYRSSQSDQYPNISISDDYGLTWYNNFDYEKGGESFQILPGRSLAIKGDNPDGFNHLNVGIHFNIQSAASSSFETNEIEVSGNLMALINNGSGINCEIPSSYCFNELFQGCNITNASELKMPETPSTIDDPIKCPEYCFSSMFSMCRNLKKAPILPAKTLWKNCYDSMFSSCEKLEFLQVGFTDWKEDSHATLNWMRDVKTSGTFVCPQELEEKKHDDIQLPNYVYKDWTYQRVNFTNCPFDYFVFNKQDL